MKEWLSPMFFAALTMLSIFVGVSLASCADNHLRYEKERKARFLTNNSCKITGYYGRSGEYKTYNCNGLIVKESDI